MSFNLNKLVQAECGGPNPLVAAAQQISMRPSTSRTVGPHQQQARQPGVDFAREFLQQSSKSQPSQLSADFEAQASQYFPSRQAPSASLLYSTSTQASQTAGGLMSGKLARDYLAEQEISDRMGRLRAGQMNSPILGPHPMTSSDYSMMSLASTSSRIGSLAEPARLISSTLSARDQLESKYRQDMISQTAAELQPQHQAAEQADKLAKTGRQEKVDDVQFWQALSQQYGGMNTVDEVNLKSMNLNRMRTNLDKMFPKPDLVEPAKTEAEARLADKQEASAESADSEGLLDFEGMSLASRRALRPEDVEYVFDERNPLKDQFADPFAEGLNRLAQGDIPSAVLLFEEAVLKEPQRADAWRYLGTTQAQNERDSSAIRALRSCLQLDANDQEARFAIAVSLANENNHHEGCRHLLEWLIRNERYRSVGASLEEYSHFDSEINEDPFFINDVDEKHYLYVRDKFVEAARQSPNDPDPEVQSALGVLFNMRGDYEKSVDCFKAALSVRNNDSLLWNRLGATLANGNKSDEAVGAYQKALELSPGFLRSRYNLAISLIHLNTYDEAAKQLVQILNMQAAGKGTTNDRRYVGSSAIWSTLRTAVTLMNKPQLYPMIDGRDLARCNQEILGSSINVPTTSQSEASTSEVKEALSSNAHLLSTVHATTSLANE